MGTRKIRACKFFSKHTKNHKVLDHYFGINYNEERRKLITDHLEGTELTIYDSEDMGIYLEKKGDFYVLEHNTPFPDEVVGDAGANCKLTYDQSKYSYNTSEYGCPYRPPTKPIVSWVACSEGRVQPGAIVAGREFNNPYTFIGRVTLRNEQYEKLTFI